MSGLLSLIGSGVVVVLWGMGSTRRLRLVKDRIGRDWKEVVRFLQQRSHLLFQIGREEVVEAHEELTAALQEVEGEGGPLKTDLKRLKEAEQALQQILGNLQPSEVEPLEGISDRLLFATETYNDGIRLLRRLKKIPFHLPIALFVCPRRVDLFESDSYYGQHATTIKFEQ